MSSQGNTVKRIASRKREQEMKERLVRMKTVLILSGGSMKKRYVLPILFFVLTTFYSVRAAWAQGIPVVGGGTLSYARPSSPLPCGAGRLAVTGTIYNFYGYVYFFNGAAYGTSTGGTFWRSINCSTLRPDPPETATFNIPGFQGGACTIAFTIFNANQTSAVRTCPPVTATPVISPAPGTYSSSQTVSIADATPGATVYVTTDGSLPTQQSPPYTGPFTIAASDTVRAVALSAGATISGTATAAYVINLPTTATPVIAPASGTINAPQQVTVSDATPGSTIYITFDGSTPTAAAMVYTAPLTVTASEVIKAVAIAPNYLPSAISSAAYTAGSAGIVTLTEIPTSAFTNQATTVTFTAHLGNDPTLQPGSVTLLESHADGSPEGVAGFMYDDGTHGDAKAGDGIFTAEVPLTSSSEAALFFQVSSTHKNAATPSLSKAVEFDIVRQFTQAEVAAIFNVPQTARQHLQTLYAAGLTQKQAQTATITWLQQQPNVYQAGGDDDGGLWYLLTSGVAGGVLLDSPGLRGGAGAHMAFRADARPGAPLFSRAAQAVASGPSTDTIFNNKGIVLAPYQSEFLGEGGDESASIAYSLRKSCVSVATGGPIANGAADVPTFKTLGQYGAVSVVSHGDTWYGGLTWETTNFPLLNHYNNANVSGPNDSASTRSLGPQVVIFTGQQLTLANEAALLLNISSYAADLKALNLVIGTLVSTGDLAFAVTPRFINTYASAQGSRLVYAGACRTYFTPDPVNPNPGQPSNVPNATMAQAFAGQGPTYTGSYFGYTEYVSSSFASSQGPALFNSLAINGTTTGAAYAPLAGKSDPVIVTPPIPGKTGQAQLVLYGDSNLTLPYCVQSDNLAQFVFLDGAPGNITVSINGAAQQLTGLGPLSTRDLGFSNLPAGSNYTMLVYANGGFADYTVNLPPGFAFADGQVSETNHVISFAGPVSYQFHSVVNTTVPVLTSTAAIPNP